jgi:hypothetical protein
MRCKITLWLSEIAKVPLPSLASFAAKMPFELELNIFRDPALSTACTCPGVVMMRWCEDGIVNAAFSPCAATDRLGLGLCTAGIAVALNIWHGAALLIVLSGEFDAVCICLVDKQSMVSC